MSNTKNTEESQDSQESQDSREGQDSQQARTSRTPRKRTAPRKRPENDSDPAESTTERKKPKPMQVLRQAREQLAELTGMEAESVSSFEQTSEGWVLEVEVLELERVPDTMSLMASYQVELDPDGDLTGYRRVRRYERGRADARRPGGR
ncbi:gas vesicle protein [Actinospica acidiphila]|uniref:Gas vesicle protein n=1 Tax=Streptomyces tunisiensis TaxID=948699 RepID=A0ABP7YVR2_9ACTN|nr:MULTISPECIES: gas vesicle protein GvpO [unclassified Streptomyces]AXI89706.1 gas vesicle protein [Streptomyces sp. ETH9427]NEA82056.1 gas vesicle protein [Actinospica acidiphila]PWE10203.1 gas vesicle protein [Streptomyces sp. BSE7F]WPW22378.1 gas vesicle protein GvpO [Streptomyces griseoincarnatus]MBJ6642840.1 gas vesicle protein [Streptomyces sp. BSE7-9]